MTNHCSDSPLINTRRPHPAQGGLRGGNRWNIDREELLVKKKTPSHCRKYNLLKGRNDSRICCSSERVSYSSETIHSLHLLNSFRYNDDQTRHLVPWETLHTFRLECVCVCVWESMCVFVCVSLFECERETAERCHIWAGESHRSENWLAPMYWLHLDDNWVC